MLANYPFLTPRVEIKKSNLCRVSRRVILGRFSNTAAVAMWWDIFLSVGSISRDQAVATRPWDGQQKTVPTPE